VGNKPVGTLVVSNVRPGKRLYLLSTGTGLAPFLSIIRDPETYEQFEHVVVAHGVRFAADLAYSDYIKNELPQHEFIGEQVRQQLLYYPTVTRESFENQGRLTELLESGKLCTDIGLPPLDPEHDRVLVCGGPRMLEDIVKLLETRGFKEGSSHEPADYTIERAFVER
jgi:ferredoxin--NADP+ reductase